VTTGADVADNSRVATDPASGTWDVVVLGGGTAAEAIAERVGRAGRSLAVVERRLVGGECPYFACMPSKAWLHAGARGMAWPDAVEFRDRMAGHHDDGQHEQALLDNGATLLRGEGVITGPGRLLVDGREIGWRDLVVATGSGAVTPPVDGIDTVDLWHSEDALTATERPDRLLVLGGGPVGCELAQAYSRLGSEVVLLEVADRLLAGEPEMVAVVVTEALRLDGVEVLTGVTVDHVEPVGGDGVTLVLDDGDRIDGDRLLVTAGKRARTAGLGLETLGVTPRDDGSLAVDEHCRVADKLWAAGDVTGLAPYTHAANAQAAVVAANLLGDHRRYDGRAVPRSVYTDPAVLSVGRTRPGRDVVVASGSAGGTSRAAIEQRREGRLQLVAESGTGVLVGATVVAADAESWAGELVLAVQARLTVTALTGVVHAFPTYAEALDPVYQDLLHQLADDRDQPAGAVPADNDEHR
jgi:dihydrolipoamide dehydrogenase